MIIDQIRKQLVTALEDCFGVTGIEPELSFPDPEHGDVATNVALGLAGQLKRSPHQIAQELAEAIKGGDIVSAEAVNGFLNMRVSDQVLLQEAAASPPKLMKGQVVVAEYSDPNPFKALHAGHLYTTLVGDAVSNLLEAVGARVHRVNFGGDVGLHVAKAMWGIVQELGGEHPDKLAKVTADQRPQWLSRQYVVGNKAYQAGGQAKDDITALNQRVYQLYETGDRQSDFARIYWTCREWSYAGFEALYQNLGVTAFEKYYPESQTASIGVDMVKKGLQQGVFEQSDGAVVYRGEPEGLHTRVFLNSIGLPTYEAKDLGLAIIKDDDFKADLSLIITANDIIEYMKVVQAAVRHVRSRVADSTRHLTHGMIRLAGNAKMSSREGNVLLAEDVLEAAHQANHQLMGKEQPEVVLAAIKYALLKQRTGGNIVYDPAESVALTGDSGPYLQYAHARAVSILAKALANQATSGTKGELEPAEHRLLRRLAEAPTVVAEAATEFQPHSVATYLYSLSQEFNRFYDANQVVGSDREAVRLQLVTQYAATLKFGLKLLGIAAPDRI